MDSWIRTVDNDTRGWILCIISGIACLFGASIICVDAFVRLFPGKRSFRIEESNVFLACSLSLSFGVMLFSSLYSMLPESKEYLTKDNWSEKDAGLLMMLGFIAGFFGIQIISRLLHQYIPSHVVDCDHSHDETTSHQHQHTHRDRSRSHSHGPRHSAARKASPHLNGSRSFENGNGHVPAESTPLLATGDSRAPRRHVSSLGDELTERPASPLTAGRGRSKTIEPTNSARKPSMLEVQKRVISFVKDTKCNCDESGSCYGYTDPCGQECFKHLSARTSHSSGRTGILRTTTGTLYPQPGSLFSGGRYQGDDELGEGPIDARFRTSRATSREQLSPFEEETCEEQCSSSSTEEEDDGQHHHHVPTNAFLSIGLQTSIAIALHKFPEGFITYATNHANPTLGFNVFMALFVHNISEGFAMALPLYMALGSRWKAMIWSSLLGGLSQPMGAGLAALWFKLAKHTNVQPSPVVYACLFAITAGIMVSVALQLFVESLSLNHNRNLCIFFGFTGMAILGLSNALFGGH